MVKEARTKYKQKRLLLSQRKFWMVSSFYLKRFLSVRDFFFFLIMKTRFSKDDRYIFGKKKKKTNKGNLSPKNSFDSKYLTSLNKDPAFQDYL